MKSKISRKLINLFIGILICVVVAVLLNGCSKDNSEDTEIEESVGNDVSEVPEAPSWTYDGGNAVIPGEKSEIVTASSDPSGSVYKIMSSVTIADFEGAEAIKDISNLSNIKNRNGAEELDYRENEGVVYWENQGSSIEYEGEGLDKLPIDLKITYWLNDEEVSAKEISGKSGHFKIRIDYVNNTFGDIAVDGTEYNVPVPFAVITALFFPEGTIKNFDGDGARLSKISSQDVVMGMAFPGIREALNLEEKDFGEDLDFPAFIEFQGDTEDFRMDFSTTIIQNGIFSEEEKDDESEESEDTEDKDEIQELIDSMKDLKKATDSLVDGADSLLSGEKKLKSGIEKYLEGVSSVSAGAGSLYDGISTLNSNGQALVDGAEGLSSGASQMSLAVSSYLSDLEKQLSAGSDSGSIGGSSTIDSIPDISINITIPEDIPESQKQELEAIKASMETQAQQLNAAKQGLKTAAEQVEAGRQALIQAQDQVKNTLLPTVQELSSQLDTLSEGASQLSSGIKAYTEGVSQLESGAKGLKDGAEQLSSQNKTIKDGLTSLENGISSFKDGLIKYRDDGINELVTFVEDDLADLNARVKALKEQDESYGNFSGADDKTKTSVTYIIETDEI